MIKPDWIAVDWGTSNLRIWGMRDVNDASSILECVIEERSSSDGMSTLNPENFEPLLLEKIEGWLDESTKPVPVIACGMVGSRHGWFEAPYVEAAEGVRLNLVKIACKDSRISPFIISGVKQSCPADVMRGEETQIFGFLSQNKGFEGVICLPGTHSKWARVSDQGIQSFQTTMTGEFFALLSKKSVLKASLGEWNETVFLQAFETAFQTPEQALSQLFQIRATSLLNDDQNGIAKLSGTLLGLEISGMRSFWAGQQVSIVGANRLSALYLRALQVIGVQAVQYDGNQMTLLGLQRAYMEMKS